MSSNLPPGVTDSMIPGNRPEDFRFDTMMEGDIGDELFRLAQLNVSNEDILDGLRKLYAELAASAVEPDDEDEVARRIAEHEEFLGSEGADHLFEGRGE